MSSITRARTRTTRQSRTEAYEAANHTCARIIADNPQRYPGIMQEWATLVLYGDGTASREWRLVA